MTFWRIVLRNEEDVLTDYISCLNYICYNHYYSNFPGIDPAFSPVRIITATGVFPRMRLQVSPWAGGIPSGPDPDNFGREKRR
jgi:hypothetical protein